MPRASRSRAHQNLYNPLALAAATAPHFTLHSDAFVSPPDALRILWAARTRKTQDVVALQQGKSGYTADCPEVLAPEQQVSIAEAIRALTVGAAYSLMLENEKGSLAPGKHADMTILSADPLAMEANPDALLDIAVVATVQRGQVHWFAGDEP